MVQKIIVNILVTFVKAYRYCISPMLQPHCRFIPSCSEYTIVALQKHGLWRGLNLAVRRVCRCHPGSAGGIEEVPHDYPKKNKTL
ncbi:MAG: membrane protein insertion efficiency factor YidD [Candidatus Oxydemutatoraceae bacterium WSBS_2016_MAG_OTU14]